MSLSLCEGSARIMVLSLIDIVPFYLVVFTSLTCVLRRFRDFKGLSSGQYGTASLPKFAPRIRCATFYGGGMSEAALTAYWTRWWELVSEFRVPIKSLVSVGCSPPHW